MASGLVALLDDVVAITKLAAASLDDVAGAAGKAGTKAAGVVIDDTAVTPRYVTGLTPDRELPIIWRIALGSIRNKLLFLLPGAIALSALAPWLVQPLLMIGGAYLCFEAAEKLIEAVAGHHAEGGAAETTTDPQALENEKVTGAVRTDLILSAEIMAITLASVADKSLFTQGVVLAVVGIGITVGVYGVVALIVKMDDIGLHLAQRRAASARAIGRGLVRAMPVLLEALSVIGTAAMAWVGGGIIVHGLEHYHIETIPSAIHDAAGWAEQRVAAAPEVANWVVTTLGSALVGLVIGAIIALAMHLLGKHKKHPVV